MTERRIPYELAARATDRGEVNLIQLPGRPNLYVVAN